MLTNNHVFYSGGMGLTGGIADVGSLYDCLVGIHTGQAGDDILDKYDEIRRQIWRDIINPISSSNMRRLIDLDADRAIEQDAFLRLLKRIATDRPLQLEMSKGIVLPFEPSHTCLSNDLNYLRHDVTQTRHERILYQEALEQRSCFD